MVQERRGCRWETGSVLLSRAFGHGFFVSPGNSHSRGVQPLLAIPDAPPRFFAHRARSASVPLAPPWPNLAKYNVARWLVMEQEIETVDGK